MSRQELIDALAAFEQEERVDPDADHVRDSRERYEDLFEFAPCGYVTLDAAGIVLELNHAAAALFGASKQSVVGMPLAHWVAPGDRRTWLDHLRAARLERAGATVELELDAGNPRRRVHAELVSRVVPVTAEGVVHIRSIILDLTERDRAREQAEQLRLQKERAEATSEAKGRFLAMLSHELRTPLTPILAAASELETRRELPEDVARMLSMIRRNAEVEAGLIDDLLDLTRIERGKLRIAHEPVDVNDIVRSVIAMCAENIAKKEVSLAIALDAEQPFVNGDTTRLHQIVWNLMSNALRHTPPGGTIHVRTHDESAMLCITIADTGDGIDPLALPRLFSPFEQLDEGPRRIGALGLGLAITRGLVDAHGGTIAAHSEGRGRGAAFEVLLPLAPTSDRPPGEPPPSRPPPARDPAHVSILLVEDNSDTAELMTLLLKRTGFSVRTAQSLHEARALMSDDVTLVITDLGLPDGTGVELVEELRRTHDVPAIALTGYGSDADVAQTTAAGFSAHLTKPVRYEDLVRVIESVRK